MHRIPFGVSRLDALLGGGAPAGSVVLLAGESGAGAREFLYTSAAMNALANAGDERFDLYYGDLPSAAEVPPEVHYLSITGDEEVLQRELAFTMATDVAEAAIGDISVRDFSPEYFGPSQIPQEWYLGKTKSIGDLGSRGTRDDVVDALGDYFNANAAGNLVLVDSITDLVGAAGADVDWTDVAMLVRGMVKASHRWGGLVLLLVNEDTLTETEFGHLMDAASGTLRFSWESGGSRRARTMVVRQFRGVLARLEEEEIVRFETEIHEGGFDISNVRKIR